MAESARTAISCPVCWRMAITETTGAPAAAAKVSASWKLIPHSACPAAISASGVVVAYGRISRSIPASVYQPFASATKNPVWFVFGVQSRASRTLAAGPAGLEGAADGEGDAVGRARWCGRGAADVAAGLAAAGQRRAAAIEQRWWRSGTCDNAVSRCRGRRHRFDRPASFAGTSRIRFGGSVAVATLSAPTRSPEADLRFVAASHGVPDGRPTLRDVGAEPGDDVVDHLRAFGLVVELVAETGIGAPLDAGSRREHLGRGRRDEAVILAVEDERRQPEAGTGRRPGRVPARSAPRRRSERCWS